MPFFQKKPVVIEARQVGGDPDDLGEWLTRKGCQFSMDEDGECDIVTLEGVMRARVGDWIIRGVKGEFYPCKPDIFDATYEAVTDHA